MDTFLFFEPQRRHWMPRRDIGLFGNPLNFYDPWSTFQELDGPAWRPCVHSLTGPTNQCLQTKAPPQKKQVQEQADGGFKMAIDAQGYRPEEVTVKLSDGVVTVRAHHREKTDGGSISSHMVRRIKLPEGVDANALKSRLTREGKLMIEAPPAGQAAIEQQKKDAEEKQLATTQQEKDKQVQPAGDGKAFQVAFNVSDFKPEEVSVKVDGGVVTVDATHEETSDKACSSYRLLRKFTLPPHVNPDHVTSRLTQEGQLMIEAPSGGQEAMETDQKPALK